MKKFKILKCENLLELAIAMLTIVFFFKASGIIVVSEMIENIIIVIASFLLVIHIIIQKYSIKTLFIYAVLILLALYSTLITKKSGILESVLVCISIREYNFNRIIDIIYKISKDLLFVHLIIFSILFIIGRIDFFSDYYGVLRASFGFIHPNLFSIYLFNIILMWTWLNFKNINNKHILMITVITTIAFLFTKTRTAYITELIFIITLFLGKKKIYIPKKIISFLFPIFAILMIFLVEIYIGNNNLAEKINYLLSGRIKLAAYAYQNYGFSLWGQNIDYSNISWDIKWKMNTFTFDCLYTCLAFNIGIIWIVMLSICLNRVSQYSNKANLYIFIWMLYSLTEVHPMTCFYLFPILLCSFCLYKKPKEQIEYDENFKDVIQ